MSVILVMWEAEVWEDFGLRPVWEGEGSWRNLSQPIAGHKGVPIIPRYTGNCIERIKVPGPLGQKEITKSHLNRENVGAVVHACHPSHCKEEKREIGG
jgi:hypothetical protein